MDLSFLSSPDAWLTLVTLSALEIVLGIDNLVFISIAVGRLPEERRPLARRIGSELSTDCRCALRSQRGGRKSTARIGLRPRPSPR